MAKKTKEAVKKEPVENVETTEEVLGEEAVNALENFMEHQRKALAETRKAVEGLIPTSVREHGSAAVNEAVEGYRQLFNTIVDELNENVNKVRSRFEREVPEKVEIEADAKVEVE